MYGGRLPDIDSFTLDLFTNREVMEMYQTITSQRQVYRDEDWIIWQAQNEESKYVALFNVSENGLTLPDNFISEFIGKEKVMDLWKSEIVNTHNQKINSHGALLIRK